MNDSYYHIGQQILKNNKSKHYDLFLYDADEGQERLNNDKFQMALNLLRDKYQVIYKLFGDQNFELVCYDYFLYNPIHSASNDDYGKSFSDFLGNIEQLQEMRYLKWLAKLDWFWWNRNGANLNTKLPKGTLNSWASIYKDMDAIDIFIDESVMEKLQIEKTGNQFKIIAD